MKMTQWSLYKNKAAMQHNVIYVHYENVHLKLVLLLLCKFLKSDVVPNILKDPSYSKLATCSKKCPHVQALT